MPDNYELEFTGSKNENEFVKSFHFRKPSNFKYKAGQFVVLRLIDENLDPKSSLRQFSLSSSPYEEYLAITTTIKGRNSKFKESLDSMKRGQELKMFGPNGNFFLEDEKDCLLIAGDIGITPFRSIIMQSLFEKRNTRFTLIHYCSSENFRLFNEELKKVPVDMLRIINVNVDSSAQITLKSTDSIDHIKEYIDEKNNEGTRSAIMIAGPTLFVDSVIGQLRSLNIKNDLKIKKEKFTGY